MAAWRLDVGRLFLSTSLLVALLSTAPLGLFAEDAPESAASGNNTTDNNTTNTPQRKCDTAALDELKSAPGNQLIGDVNGSTPLFVTLSVNKVGSINAVDGTFWFDFYIYVAWRDDRQTVEAREAAAEAACMDPPGDTFTVTGPDDGWFPRPELMNKNTEDSEQQWLCLWGEQDDPPLFAQAELVRGGDKLEGVWATCQRRHQVTLDADLQLQNFPFDTQYAHVILESFNTQETGMFFRPVVGIEKGLVPAAGVKAVSGWTIISSTAHSSSHVYEIFDETYHQLRLTLEMRREPDYYVTRYVWGVVFLVAMALLTLFDPADDPNRLGFVQSSFLGIVSWQFIVVSSVPVTGYNTRLDDFMILSMVITFITYVWNSVRPLAAAVGRALAPAAPCPISGPCTALARCAGAHRVLQLVGGHEQRLQREAQGIRGGGSQERRCSRRSAAAAADPSGPVLHEHELPLVDRYRRRRDLEPRFCRRVLHRPESRCPASYPDQQH